MSNTPNVLTEGRERSMKTAKRWFCSVSSLRFEHCRHGGGSVGNPGKMPRSGKCPKCGGSTYEREGVYAVFRHRGDGKYRLAESLGHRLTEKAADRLAHKIDPTGTTVCVRFI